MVLTHTETRMVTEPDGCQRLSRPHMQFVSIYAKPYILQLNYFHRYTNELLFQYWRKNSTTLFLWILSNDQRIHEKMSIKK